jgi:hypothetical protein
LVPRGSSCLPVFLSLRTRRIELRSRSWKPRSVPLAHVRFPSLPLVPFCPLLLPCFFAAFSFCGSSLPPLRFVLCPLFLLYSGSPLLFDFFCCSSIFASCSAPVPARLFLVPFFFFPPPFVYSAARLAPRLCSGLCNTVVAPPPYDISHCTGLCCVRLVVSFCLSPSLSGAP